MTSRAGAGLGGLTCAPTFERALTGLVGVSGKVSTFTFLLAGETERAFGATSIAGSSTSVFSLCSKSALSAALRALRRCFFVVPGRTSSSASRLVSGFVVSCVVGSFATSMRGEGSSASSELLSSDSSSGGSGAMISVDMPRPSNSLEKLPNPTPPSARAEARACDGRRLGDVTSRLSESIKSKTGLKFQPVSSGCEGMARWALIYGRVVCVLAGLNAKGKKRLQLVSTKVIYANKSSQLRVHLVRRSMFGETSGVRLTV